MKKNLDDYLPKKKQPTKPVQAYIPQDLFEKVDAFRRENEATWTELVEALFRRMMDERPRARKF